MSFEPKYSESEYSKLHVHKVGKMVIYKLIDINHLDLGVIGMDYGERIKMIIKSKIIYLEYGSCLTQTFYKI